ncbi:MAG: hypothetical protein ACE5GA_00150 [Candidatus Zixiibacteriota bacterium]
MAIYNRATTAESRIARQPAKTKQEKDQERKTQKRRADAEDLSRNPVFVDLIKALEGLLDLETKRMRRAMPQELNKQQGVARGIEMALEFIKTKLGNTPKPKRSPREDA